MTVPGCVCNCLGLAVQGAGGGSGARVCWFPLYTCTLCSCLHAIGRPDTCMCVCLFVVRACLDMCMLASFR